MNIKVAAFTVSEKSINTTNTTVLTGIKFDEIMVQILAYRQPLGVSKLRVLSQKGIQEDEHKLYRQGNGSKLKSFRPEVHLCSLLTSSGIVTKDNQEYQNCLI